MLKIAYAFGVIPTIFWRLGKTLFPDRATVESDFSGVEWTNDESSSIRLFTGGKAMC
jgi:hypothetical protein